MSPWIGVVVISLGLGVTVALILTHNAVPATVGAVITAGIGLLQAAGHGQARELAVTQSAVPAKWLQEPVFAPSLTKVASWLPHARTSGAPPAMPAAPAVPASERVTERPPTTPPPLPSAHVRAAEPFARDAREANDEYDDDDSTRRGNT